MYITYLCQCHIVIISIVVAECDMDMLELGLRQLANGELTGAVARINQAPDMYRFRVGQAPPDSKNSLSFSVPSPTTGQPHHVEWLSLMAYKLRILRLYFVSRDGSESLVKEKV